MSHHNWLRGRTVVYQPSAAATVAPPAQKSEAGFSILAFFKSILRTMWGFIKGLALFIGLVFIFFFALTLMFAEQQRPVALPSQMVLTLKIKGELPETSGASQMLALIQRDKAIMTLEDIVDTIDRASKDDRVKVLAVKASGGGYNLTQLQSIREAVLRFKASGKKSVIFSESYGEGGYGLGIYYLATAFDEIWMQPVGSVAVGGVNMQIPFFKDLMDEYGVKAQFFQRKEYKNAMEHLTSDKMSAASRESVQSLVSDLATQLVEPIKASRKKLSGSFDSLLNEGFFTDKAALEAGLVDKLSYEDMMLDAIKKRFVGVEFVSFESYSSVLRQKQFEAAMLKNNKQGVVIAVIPVEGMIVSGSAKSSPFGMNDKVAAADDIAASIEEAARNNSVQAIVLRVNSPGGSPTASETIHRSLMWAKTVKQKPIIVSMGAMAASGGYWVSTPADRIYAMDSTLTGSIGVVGGKLNLQGMWNKLNINWETVKYGDNSGMMSMNDPFTASEQKQFEASLDNIYDYFITRVAEGRHLTPEQVEAVAKGRAYTGRQALKLGLVDEIGGMDKVLDDLARANKVKSRHDLNLIYLPRTNDPVELFLMMLSEEVGLTPMLQKVSSTFQPLMAVQRLSGRGAVFDSTVGNGRIQ